MATNKSGKKRKVAELGALTFQERFVREAGTRLKELLQERNNLSREDLEYLAEASAKLKDTRLKHCIATLVGWGDDERAELETFCAVALEVMKEVSPSRLRDAARKIELHYHLKRLDKVTQPGEPE